MIRCRYLHPQGAMWLAHTSTIEPSVKADRPSPSVPMGVKGIAYMLYQRGQTHQKWQKSQLRGPVSPKLKKSIKKRFIAEFSEKFPNFLAYSGYSIALVYFSLDLLAYDADCSLTFRDLQYKLCIIAIHCLDVLLFHQIVSSFVSTCNVMAPQNLLMYCGLL